MATTTATELNISKLVAQVLDGIEKEREREIVSRRFGLSGRKETLEEIGQLLGITRERVRQIEKQVVTRLKAMRNPTLDEAAQVLTEQIEQLGRIVPVAEVSGHFKLPKQNGHAQISFLAALLPTLEVIPDSDDFEHSVAVKKHHDVAKLHKLNKDLVSTVKSMDKPARLEEIQSQLPFKLDLDHAHGLARASKHVTSLDGKWGLTSNPLVNPKSIRDKIYVVLKKTKKPLHFSEISSAIKGSNFKRRDVTTQAIHNELIKDDRFILVGRGIYALKEWGYKRGTVADVIADILKTESPLHRDEIVKRVLGQRQVKPTTIILNLQGKNQFKRVAKATYALAA